MEEDNTTLQQIACFCGFMFVLYRSLTLENYPLLETDPKPRETHKWRLITASFYIPFVPGSAIFAPIIFKLFITLMVYLAVDEFMQVIFELRRKVENKKQYHQLSKSPEFLLMTKNIQWAGVLVSLSAYPGDLRLFGLAIYVCFIWIIVYYMVNFERLGMKNNFFEALGSLCIFLLSLIWITWSLSHGILLAECEYGGGYLTIMLCVSWIGDASAYYIGSRFGSHKVTQISPNKSWEGIIAEIVFALLLSSIFKYSQVSGIVPWMNLPPIAYIHYILLGLVIGIMGVIGDIFESLVKRVGSAKDSGIFFPGHGGVLDRFDAFLLMVPASYYYIVFIVNTRALEEIDWTKYGLHKIFL